MKDLWKKVSAIFLSILLVVILSATSSVKQSYAASSPTNTALGAASLAHITSGAYNTSVGYKAGYYISNGSNNVAIGNYAGVTQIGARALTTGKNNLFLGAYSGPTNGAVSNSSAIGTFSGVTESNAINLGCNVGYNGCTVATKVGIDNPVPMYALDVNGSISSSNGLFVKDVQVCSVNGCKDDGSNNTYVKNSTSIQYNQSLLYQNASTTLPGLLVRSQVGQTSSLVIFQNSNAQNVFSINPNGSTTLTTSTNSTNALQVQNSSASDVLDVDTTNNFVGVNTSTPAYSLDVNGNINASTNLYIGGKLICTSNGCISNSPSILTNGHIITPAQSSPTMVVSTNAAGAGSVAHLSGNDNTGQITFTTTTNTSTGVLVDVTYAKSFPNFTNAFVTLTPASASSATSSGQYYVTNMTNTGFQIAFTGPPQGNTTYSFDYWVAE